MFHVKQLSVLLFEMRKKNVSHERNLIDRDKELYQLGKGLIDCRNSINEKEFEWLVD